jgi:lipid-binding SYLF domain-containing protein
VTVKFSFGEMFGRAAICKFLARRDANQCVKADSMKNLRIWLIAVLALGVIPAVPVAAQDNIQQRKLLLEAEAALIDLRAEAPLADKLNGAISNASAVLIVPNLLKGAFILGGEGGRGVLLARRDDGTWSAPVFVTLGAASVGLQAGGQTSKVLFTVMNDAALEALLTDQVKLGGDLGIGVAHIGAGVEASTTTARSDDIRQFAVSQGLFGGGALEGAVIEPRASWNETYYGRTLGPKSIVGDASLAAPGADALRAALNGS